MKREMLQTRPAKFLQRGKMIIKMKKRKRKEKRWRFEVQQSSTHHVSLTPFFPSASCLTMAVMAAACRLPGNEPKDISQNGRGGGQGAGRPNERGAGERCASGLCSNTKTLFDIQAHGLNTVPRLNEVCDVITPRPR